MNNHNLTSEQINQFREDGFIILKVQDHGLIKPGRLQKWSAEVRNWPKVTGKWMPYEEINAQGETQLLRTENFVDFHPDFHQFLCGEGLVDVLKQVTGETMLLFKDKINYKLPHGNGFGAHLDAPAYDHIGKIEHLTANLAVDKATAENGCLEVVPGSHKMNVPFVTGGHITADWEASQDWLPVPLDPGDILVFGSHLAHRSGQNKTLRSRTMVYATYYRKSDGLDLRQRYYADRRANFPPEHERVVGKDYSQGWERYAFAAPFSSQGIKISSKVEGAAVH